MAITKVLLRACADRGRNHRHDYRLLHPLVKAIYAIPLPVIGGLEIYLFGAIAAGIAIMIDKNVDMFSAKNIAVIATIMVIGLGGHAFGGVIPFFGTNCPRSRPQPYSHFAEPPAQHQEEEA